MYDLKDGEFLIKTARRAVKEYLKTRKIVEIPKNTPKKLLERKGVFVTIKTISGELRGCIGFSLPVKPLILAVIQSAVNSAFFDHRFSPLTEEELRKIAFEISILTDPKLLAVKKPKDYLERIEVGRDGLIVELDLNVGLLLPQVPVEQNWNTKQFLEYACLKAGLDKDAWLDPKVKIYTFQAEIFKELKPKGKVVKVSF
jgi:hypothetical protein